MDLPNGFKELLAKQWLLAEIYNRRKREYKLEKNREEKARARTLRQNKKGGVIVILDGKTP